MRKTVKKRKTLEKDEIVNAKLSIPYSESISNVFCNLNVDYN